MADNDQAAETTQAKDAWVLVDTPEGEQQQEEQGTQERCVLYKFQ